MFEKGGENPAVPLPHCLQEGAGYSRICGVKRPEKQRFSGAARKKDEAQGKISALAIRETQWKMVDTIFVLEVRNEQQSIISF